jgi:hypothetical protein
MKFLIHVDQRDQRQGLVSDHGDDARSRRLLGVPGIFALLLQANTLTRDRPLGHAEISTGSPRLFHWVTQGFAWVTQGVSFRCLRAFAVDCSPITAITLR